jgi:flagellar biosynthetic protein FliR
VSFTIPTVWLAGFLLALARSGAWALVAPPFATPMIPVRVRVGFAVAISFLVANDVPTPPAVDSPAFLAAIVMQVALGLALGFLVYLVIAAVEAAGHILDVVGGFGMAQLYDPFTSSTSAPLGRLYQLLVMVLLFVLNGHVRIVRGFLASFRALPLDAVTSPALLRLLTEGMGTFLVAALQIALPIAAALFLADVALALVSRAAPRIDVLVLGLGTKALIILLITGLTLPLIPHALQLLVERAAHLEILSGG